ncbi:uncharacterized protein LOC123681764 [Harmonia axyridis]|uniref:uncharacterized protein LOC123681764 n=1 Tax=Harmonia axyridis TaxID=115357 RepID=UPI001E276AA7|nr:uncharacterized protein LOC123681764 [Harmonia axyridis]XP_045476001.1 uncharacterized protein LOC123681764 [Harmonia axyridis]XP_045476002.1 uncharacterized protein LOC123681764 [Harmonia axyridis]
MHGSAGLHSAMAIKRQRRIREQAKKRERERRLSSRTSSIDSIDHPPSKKVSSRAPPSDPTLASGIGMLHIGVCFIVFGLFLVGSGLLPDDMMSWTTGGYWNELVATGIFVICIGIFLLILNLIVSKKEEEDLNDYVQRQLTRSRSGHRLERDVETGCLTTKNYRKAMEKKREDRERGVDLTPVHSPHNKSAPPHNQHVQNGEAHLEKILEEDVFEREDVRHTDLRETISNTTTASLSPGSPSETRELIINGRQFSFNSRQY